MQELESDSQFIQNHHTLT